MTGEVLEGHCLCGAVTVRVDGAHIPAPGVCHCRMCQRWSGGIYMSFEADAQAVTVTGEVRHYASSAFAERAFCPVCGSHLWMRDTDKAEEPYELMPGLFDDARTWKMWSEIYVDDAIARVAGDHPTATRAEYEAKHKHVEGDA